MLAILSDDFPVPKGCIFDEIVGFFKVFDMDLVILSLFPSILQFGRASLIVEWIYFFHLCDITSDLIARFFLVSCHLAHTFSVTGFLKSF